MVEIYAKVADVKFEPQGIVYFLYEFGKDNGTGMGVLHCKELEEGKDEETLSEEFVHDEVRIHYWCDKDKEVRSIDYTEFVRRFTEMVNENIEDCWYMLNDEEGDLDLHNDFLDMLEGILYGEY